MGKLISDFNIKYSKENNDYIIKKKKEVINRISVSGLVFETDYYKYIK